MDEDSTMDDGSDIAYFEDDEDAAWASFSKCVAEAKTSLSRIHWSSVGDRIADKVIPEWAKTLPGVSKNLHYYSIHSALKLIE